MRLAQGWWKMVRQRLGVSTLDVPSKSPRRVRSARSRSLRLESLENRALMTGLVGDLWADGCKSPTGSSEASSASNEQGEFAIASAEGEDELPVVSVSGEPDVTLGEEEGERDSGFALQRSGDLSSPLTVALSVTLETTNHSAMRILDRVIMHSLWSSPRLVFRTTRRHIIITTLPLLFYSEAQTSIMMRQTNGILQF